MLRPGKSSANGEEWVTLGGRPLPDATGIRESTRIGTLHTDEEAVAREGPAGTSLEHTAGPRQGQLQGRSVEPHEIGRAHV